MKPETEQFLLRRQQWLNQATSVIQKHAPLLSSDQALEVAKICLLSWQDMRHTVEWQECSEFIETL
jgi:hypothetical protein